MSGTPQVLVNLLWMVPGVVGGSESSTTDALRAVADLLDGQAGRPGGANLEIPSIRLAVLEPFTEAHPDLVERLGAEVLNLDGSNKARRVLAEQTWLARTARRVGAQVVHHAGGVVPLLHPGRIVLTIHDLQPLDMPENFAAAKRSYIRLMAGRSARAATVVVVPSEFTRRRTVELLGVDPNRIVVVPWSVRAIEGPGRQQGTFVPLSGELRRRVGDGPFLLYPAITYPHKNHLLLLEAFAAVVASDPSVRLVLTGGPGPEEAAVLARIARPDLAGKVIRLGRVSSHDLEALYAAARGVVVPSRYEGFGLPVLEAMARGVPVVASDAGSLPEVARVEDLVPAGDVPAWSAAMEALVSLGSAEREARVAAGRCRAAEFSGHRTALALVDAYRRAATVSPPPNR